MDKLKELLPKWEVLKSDHYSIFTNLDLEIVKEAHAKMFGYAARNTNCRSCVEELIMKVFKQYDKDKT